MPAVLEKYSAAAVSNETIQAKFNRLAKDHFHLIVRNDYDYLTAVKESIRFFSLDLPAEIKEIFIPYPEAPVFWIYESSLLNQIEEFMKFNLVRGNYAELHKSIKENYTKWVTTKLKSEKEYYATTTVNFIERDINKHNFFKLIIKAIILTYQSTFYNKERALELLFNAMELVNTLRMNDQTKTELKYILNLYTGFIHLKESDYAKANLSFKDAIEIKPQGCTAKIYCALTEVNLGKNDVAAYLLKEVFNYDIHRLTLALKTNNAGMFSYFFRNPFIYNIFYEKDFSKAYNSIEQILDEFRFHDRSVIGRHTTKLEELKARKLDEYYDEELKKSIAFFEKILKNYSSSTNTLFYALYPELQNKFNFIIENVITGVKEKHYAEVKEKISAFDIPIKENLNTEKHFRDELENFKIKSKQNLAESIQAVNGNYDYETHAIESRINNLPNEDRYNPGISLSNNMTYNIIIAFVVFFIGGVAGYSNTTVTDTSEFNSILTLILIAGSKWGAISFLAGGLISVLISAIILLERSDVKQKLLRRISYLKIERERLIADLKESSIQKEKIMMESFNNSINQQRKRIEELKVQKEEAERELMKDAEKKIKAVTAGLEELQSV
ncbi:MAG: hypothetical protein AB1298_00320 [Bacteroidota bacterium]